MKRSALALFAVLVVAAVFVPSASAEVRNLDTVPSCIDSIDPEVACFGSSVISSSCSDTFKSCYTSCINTEQSSNRQCSRLTDPVDQANCYAITETTAYACTGDCEAWYPCQ